MWKLLLYIRTSVSNSRAEGAEDRQRRARGMKEGYGGQIGRTEREDRACTAEREEGRGSGGVGKHGGRRACWKGGMVGERLPPILDEGIVMACMCLPTMYNDTDKFIVFCEGNFFSWRSSTSLICTSPVFTNFRRWILASHAWNCVRLHV